MIQTHLFGGAAVHKHSAMMHRLNNVPPQQTPQRDQNNIFVIPHVGNFIKGQKKPSNCVKNVGAFRSFPSNVMISNALSTTFSPIGRHILAADDDDRCHLADDGLT